MQISLSNFGCYHEKTTFDIPNGLTLISAPSGKGKSTILNGIYYALYGCSGIQSWNAPKKKVIVNFSYSGFFITRTTNPRSLILVKDEVTYEDQEAQALINSFFGEFFMVTSYISQNSEKTFLSLSATEKLDFLEKLSVSGMKDSKQKCKEIIKTLKDSLLLLTGEIKALSENAPEKPKKVEKVVESITEFKKEYENETINLKEISQKILFLNNEKKNFEQNSHKKEILNEKLNSLLEQKQNIILSSDETPNLPMLEKRLKNAINFKLYNKLKEEEKSLVYIPLEVFSDITSELKTQLQQLERKETLSKELETYKSEEELLEELKLVRKTFYNCPCCFSLIYFESENKLVKAENISYDPNEKKRSVSQVEGDITYIKKLKVLLKNIPPIHENKETILQSIEKIENLKRINSERKLIHDKIIKIQKEMSLLPYSEEEELSAEVLEEKIKAAKKILQVKAAEEEKINILNQKIEELKAIKLPDLIDPSSDLLLEEIKEKNSKEKLEKLDDVQKNINKFLIYKEKYLNYKKYSSLIEAKKSTEASVSKRFNIVSTFLSKLLIAEKIAIENTLNNINITINYYLSKFFTETPITVTLYTEEKGVKITVEYKGFECEVKNLSGGERVRVDLAICLALHEINGGSLMMLDESIGSLNQELADDILEVFKEIDSDVIFVCHQTNISSFDNLIEI